MFERVFVEKEIENWPRVQNVLAKIKGAEVITIERYDQYFGRRKKPYLHKRDSLNLFLASKKGELVRAAPAAYGVNSGKHFYFVHAYNCIYECQYCYLQGHFQSPDLVWFLNFEEILQAIKQTIESTPERPLWFHAGEFSDSLALAQLTGELPELLSFFDQYGPDVKLELRTKSVNIRPLLQLTSAPPANVTVSFSLGPEALHPHIELGVPSPRARLQAMAKLQAHGYTLGLHLDPVVITPHWQQHFQDLFAQIQAQIQVSKLDYLSLGVVRFPEKVFHEVMNNYPHTLLTQQEFNIGDDGKRKYARPIRAQLLKDLQAMALAHGFVNGQIYFCMEDL